MKRVIPILLSVLLLLTGCAGGAASEPPEISPPVIDTKSPPKITNADGVELRVGMSRAEYEEFYGQPLENGWSTKYPDGGVGALSLDNVIVALFLSSQLGNEWTLENGVKLGMPIDEVRELLGEENTVIPDNLKEIASVIWQLIYAFDDGGAMVIRYFPVDSASGEANTVYDVTLVSAQYDSSRVLGIIHADIRGEGDALLENIPVSPYVEYDLENGRGSNTEVYLVFDYEERIFGAEGGGGKRPDIITNEGKLRVESDGEWRIVARTRVPTYSSGVGSRAGGG